MNLVRRKFFGLFGSGVALAATPAIAKNIFPIHDDFSSDPVIRRIQEAQTNVLEIHLFEFNDEGTRRSCRTMLDNYIKHLKEDHHIFDYLVLCDGNNNLPDVIARKSINLDVLVKQTNSPTILFLPSWVNSYS